jgi:branched-chain amino acid transport system substrate-binding protein
MKYRALLFLFLVLPSSVLAEEPPIRVGVSSSLTGDLADSGNDILDALNFANHRYFSDRYRFIVDDDRCDNATGVTVAKKQVSIDKVGYVLGIFCNTALLAAAPVYKQAGTVVISVATTGDVRLGTSNIFRTYPAEHHAAELLYDFIAKRHRVLGVITEPDEYTAMMERSLLRKNEDGKLRIIPVQVAGHAKDFRTILLRFKREGADALYFNPRGEPGYIEMVKQAQVLGIRMPHYSNSLPASPASQKALKEADEGALFAGFPLFDVALSAPGKKIYAEYVKDKGEPRSNPIFIALAIDSLRILDKALTSGEKVPEYIRTHTFPGIVGDLSFDGDGAVTGLHYEMQEIKDGRIVTVAQMD